MQIVEDNVVVFNLLEENGIQISDYTVNQVFSFDRRNKFFLVIYCVENNNRNFKLFVIDDYKNNHSEFTELESEIQKLPAPYLVDKAEREIETIKLSLNAGNLFFDAH